MKSAKEYLKENGMSNVGHYGLLITDPSKQKMHEIMEDYAKQYAEEAIKLDRKNVSNYATVKQDGSKRGRIPTGSNFQMVWGQVPVYIVDKDSIINAPLLKLK